MENIDNIIEIKRGLHKICRRELVNVIAETEKCEDFYRNVFITYSLIYNTETLRQKRAFVAAITEYFILKRLPEACLSLNEGKYEIKANIKKFKDFLVETLDVYFTIHAASNSHEDFKKKYAAHFNEEVRDFSKEISEDRDDSLSDFAKTIKKIYNFKDKNDDC